MVALANRKTEIWLAYGFDNFLGKRNFLVGCELISGIVQRVNWNMGDFQQRLGIDIVLPEDRDQGVQPVHQMPRGSCF